MEYVHAWSQTLGGPPHVRGDPGDRERRMCSVRCRMYEYLAAALGVVGVQLLPSTLSILGFPPCLGRRDRVLGRSPPVDRWFLPSQRPKGSPHRHAQDILQPIKVYFSTFRRRRSGSPTRCRRRSHPSCICRPNPSSASSSRVIGRHGPGLTAYEYSSSSRGCAPDWQHLGGCFRSK